MDKSTVYFHHYEAYKKGLASTYADESAVVALALDLADSYLSCAAQLESYNEPDAWGNYYAGYYTFQAAQVEQVMGLDPCRHLRIASKELLRVVSDLGKYAASQFDPQTLLDVTRAQQDFKCAGS